MLRPIITANGKILLDLLVGATAVSLFSLLQSPILISLAFWVFAFVFIFDVFKAGAAQGYVTTIFSTKYIPKGYGPIRQFIRKIQNGGTQVWIRIVVFIGLAIGYPEAINLTSHNGLILTDAASIMFIFVTTAISLIQVRSLLLQTIDARAEIERRQLTDNERRAWTLDQKPDEWSEKKRNLERRIIAEALHRVGIVPWISVEKLVNAEAWTSRDLKTEPVLEHDPLVKEYGDCHLNVVIPYLQTDEATRNYIFHWARIMLEAMANSETAVTQYALSFWRRDGTTVSAKTHFGMIRASRADVQGTLSTKGLSDQDFVRKMPGRYLAAGVAEY